MKEFIENLNLFKYAVAGIKAKPWKDMETNNLTEYRNWGAQMLEAEKKAKDAGYFLQFSGQQKNGRRVMFLNTGKIHFKCVFDPKKRNTKATSVNAYRSIDFSTQEGQVAFQILSISLQGGDITRSEIGHKMGMENSTVSGRVKMIFEKYENGGFFYQNDQYRIEVSQTRLSIHEGASNVKNEAFRFVKIA
jgi:hypothetical protein